jgi:predicted ribonuclease YlaK
VRLVIPLRVIEELDAKKHARRRDLADRARRVLRRLEEQLGDRMTGPVADNVTISVLLNDEDRNGAAGADTEILATCALLGTITKQGVTLITSDTAMRLRAQAQRIRVWRVPQEYERHAATPEAQHG